MDGLAVGKRLDELRHPLFSRFGFLRVVQAVENRVAVVAA
jgi:hypothetical protein